MRGILYGVGVGPGDPELITLKAKRILEEVQVIAVPKSPAEKASTALNIVGNIAQKKNILELAFPMTKEREELGKAWEGAASAVMYQLDKGKNVAFITLGDPTVYSTFMYIYNIIRDSGYDVEIIPGITSFCGAAARAGLSLTKGTETLAIVPGTVESETIDKVFENFENIVLMKASANWEEIVSKIDTMGLLDKTVLIEKCGMEDENVKHGIDKNLKPGYFSTLIIKKGE